MAITSIEKATKKMLARRVLVRLDFNDGGWRLKESLPTLKFLRERAKSVVIIGHRGRPEPTMMINSSNKEFSLEGEAKILAKYLGEKVVFISHSRISEASNEIRTDKENRLFLLENVRFLDGEMENDSELAEHLASLGDYYVNEAFGASHRAEASVAAITDFLPSYAGIRLYKELKVLGEILDKPKKPLVIILGGAKVKDKMPVMLNFRKKANVFLVGGAIANTLLYLHGEKVGSSLIEMEMDGALLKVGEMKQIIRPVDYKRSQGKILDIGPKSIRLFAKDIAKAKTIVWSGPMGMIENKNFEAGSVAVARAVARSKAKKIIGGGETIGLIRKLKLEKKIDFMSMGGGAMLDFLAGKKLPGIEGLK